MFMQPGENKTDCNQICDLANGDQMKAESISSNLDFIRTQDTCDDKCKWGLRDVLPKPTMLTGFGKKTKIQTQFIIDSKEVLLAHNLCSGENLISPKWPLFQDCSQKLSCLYPQHCPKSLVFSGHFNQKVFTQSMIFIVIKLHVI